MPWKDRTNEIDEVTTVGRDRQRIQELFQAVLGVVMANCAIVAKMPRHQMPRGECQGYEISEINRGTLR